LDIINVPLNKPSAGDVAAMGNFKLNLFGVRDGVAQNV
jgi:hypothetical protein